MKALRWHGRGDLRLDDVATPDDLAAGTLLLAVEAAGICGTDVEEWLHGPLNVPIEPHPLSQRGAPITLGHETVGRVVDAGAGTTIPVGTAVAVEGSATCGVCPACTSGNTQRCPMLCAFGLHDDGGLADFLAIPEAACVAVPVGVPALTAVLAEPLSVAVRACDRAALGSGDTVAVVGGGTIGQLVAQVAAHRGARVVVVEPLANRRDIAGSYGADLVVAPDEAAAAVASITADSGVDVSIESAGTPAAVEMAVRVTRAGGTIVLLGVNDRPMSVTPFDLIWKEHTVIGSLSHVMDDFVKAVNLLADGTVRVDGLVTDVIPLADAVPRGFAALRDEPENHLKIVVMPDRAGPAEA